MAVFEDLTRAKLDRMARDVIGRPLLKQPSRSPPDPKLRRMHEESGRRLTRDRRAASDERRAGVHDRDHMTRWRGVMERHGFSWWSPEELAHQFGPEVVMGADADPELLGGAGNLYLHRPHSSGMWRRDHGPYPAAFRPDDLLALFENSPAAFHGWIEDATYRAAATKAGVLLPSRPKTSGKVQIFVPSVIGGPHRQ